MADPSGNSENDAAVPLATVISACAALAAAWLAAGSTGLLAEPLRIVLTYSALLVAILAGRVDQSLSRWLIGAVALVACLPLLMPVTALHELLVVAAVAGLLAAGAEGSRRMALQTSAYAIFTLAMFRLACSAVPLLWQIADRWGGALGAAAGWIAGEPLRIGATFAGMDFLVLMAALYTAWLLSTKRPRLVRGTAAASAILVGHLVYLVVVARAQDLAELLPTVDDPTFDHPYIPPDWHWSPAIAQLLPWNLPILAVVIHVAIAALMLRWVNWNSRDDRPELDSKSAAGVTVSRRRWAIGLIPLGLAMLLPILSWLSLGASDLTGKKIVANQNGRLNWERPQYDRYGQQGAGLFGMLPSMVESLGGQMQLSSELSALDLAHADVLLLLHPVGPIAEPVQERIWNFVRRGGALLIVAEPYLWDGETHSAANELLHPAAVSVRRDVAISETGSWQQACQLTTHPVVSGIETSRGGFFSDTGSSLEVGWAARPLVVGRWGWSDPGSDAVLTGIYQRERGERLGDLVLAAEQSFGAGTVTVLADDHSLTNEGLVRGYPLAGRLLAHLANRRGGPLVLWRQLLTSVCCIGLLIVLAWRPIPQRMVATILLLAVSLTMCQAASRQATRVVPDGTAGQTEGLGTASNLAYIDSSHLEAYSDTPWVFDGINGLALTLMRDGYLTAMLPELTAERLDKAAILVSIAPARRFTDTERSVVRRFVERGGIFICTVGAEQATASASLLEDFDLRVSASPVPSVGKWREPEPMGRMRSLFLNAQDYGRGDYRVGVRFHAAWPVQVRGGNADILVRDADNTPIVVARRVDQGRVVVIGDTGFAMNKNLEYVGGESFEGGYENSHFWRWLISRVSGRTEWVPPPLQQPSNDDTDIEAVPADDSLPVGTIQEGQS